MNPFAVRNSVLLRYWIGFSMLGLAVALPLISFFQGKHREALESQWLLSQQHYCTALATALELAVSDADFERVGQILGNANAHEAFKYVALFEEGQGDSLALFQCYPDSLTSQAMRQDEGWFITTSAIETAYFDGVVVLGWTDAELDQVVVPAQSPIKWLALFALLGSIVLFWLVFRAVSVPILRACEFADGLVNQNRPMDAAEMPLEGKGEFLELNRALQALSGRLDTYRSENSLLFSKLQGEVDDRTQIIEQATSYTSLLLEVSSALLTLEGGSLGSNWTKAQYLLQAKAGVTSVAVFGYQQQTGMLCCENTSVAHASESMGQAVMQFLQGQSGGMYTATDDRSFVFSVPGSSGAQGVQRCLYLQLNTSIEESSLAPFVRFGVMLASILASYNQRFFAELEVRDINVNLERLVMEKLQQNMDLSNSLVSQDKLATVGELAAQVAHDLNTPLGAVQASLENVSVMQDQLVRALAKLPPNAFESCSGFAGHLKRMGAQMQPDWLKAWKPMQQVLETKGGTDRDWKGIALKAVKMGFTEHDQDFVSVLLGVKEAEHWLNAIRLLSDLQMSFDTMASAIEKSSHVVQQMSHFVKEEDFSRQGQVQLLTNLQTVISLFQHRIKGSIVIQVDVPEDAIIVGTEIKLFQLWSNVLKNAIDALEEVHKANKRIEIRGVMEDGHWRVSIGNNGPQIPAAVQQRVFKKFFTTKAGTKGTGLGLSIVQGVLNQHGGSVELTSDETWTEFVFSFPVLQEAPAL